MKIHPIGKGYTEKEVREMQKQKKKSRLYPLVILSASSVLLFNLHTNDRWYAQAQSIEEVEGENSVNQEITPLDNKIFSDSKIEVVRSELKAKESKILTKKKAELEKQRQLRQEQISKYGVYVGKKIKAEATAYTPYCAGCIGITKTGIDVRTGTHKIIAVDPRVIPLKSTVELFLDGKSLGVYKAEDTGGDIKGTRIDILHKTKASAYEFGRRDVEVIIRALP